MFLKKEDVVEIKIEKIVYGGEGLGYYNDFAIFVPMSVPGDRLKVKIISLKKTYGRALIEEILEPGAERIEDLSKVTFEDFQGCDFAMLNYEFQLKYKRDMVEDVLRKIGKNSTIEVPMTLGSEDKFHYRNKIVEPFAMENGKIITGFFSKKSHDVFQVEENMLNSTLGNKVIDELKKLLNKEKISVYDEKVHKGILRHIMVRTNSYNEAMVVLVINGKKIDKKLENILLSLKEILKEVVSIYVSYNRERTNVALGSENILLWGQKTIRETISDIDFNISPKSFFQINVKQTRNLYNLGIECFDEIENKNVVDAYGGTGTIGMILAKKAKKVYSIEIISSATKDGIKTAEENGIKNIEFINGDVNKELGKLVKEGKVDSIIFDPPRKGIDEESLLQISKTNIREIVYISCNPSTFARDCEILEREGYKLMKVQPVDMFPQTSHIEVVGKFEKI
ncbi:MAG: 23S rRNA (uracil(1939)-C(5))-methyltransferase RlmD [Cetobacterium sp.]